MRHFFAFWLIGLFLSVPVLAHAQTEACACYCKSSSGAVLVSGGTDDAPTPDSTPSTCSTTCQSQGETMLGCYGATQTASLPVNNLMCWTEYECTSQISTDPNTSGLTYDWGGQSNGCVSSPTPEGFCYAPTTPVTLGVAIDDLSTAQDLPTYINAIYNWAIPAGALIAVVMIMIGGMQYVIARGNPTAIGVAKTRITRAVEGMVLLMFAYMILNLIDPGLVTLSTLRTPQIRRVVYLDPTSTCEYMMAYGITITPGTATTCGNTGTITSIDGYVGSGTPTVSVGDTCRYSSCTDPLAACVSSSTSMNGYACARCANAANDTLGNPFANAPAPSEATCASLTRSTTASSPDEHQYCTFYNAAVGATSEANSCTEFVYPSGDDITSLDCARLRADAMAGDSQSCRAYDLVWTIGGVFPGSTTGLYSNEVDDKNGANNDYPLLASLCAADPCGLHPPGDTCQALIVQSAVTSSVCSLPILSETPLCQAAAYGDRADCVPASYAAAMNKLLAGDELTSVEEEALYVKDMSGNTVDYNPTW